MWYTALTKEQVMPHISFSALKIWKECAFKYKLNYIDEKKKFLGNEYTVFGTALHEACERKVLDNSLDEVQIFKDKFTEELKKLPPEVVIEQKILDDMMAQGTKLSSLALDALRSYFGAFKVVNAEEELLLPLEGTEFQFKGYVDLILQTEDGKYHIIDWKTCSWGWDAEKKNDPMTNYQLTLYKHFFSKIKKVDPKLVETHFALLKRTAKKDNVELFRVTSGPKKTENALKILNNAVHNITNKNFPKNKLNCKYCEFYKTEECP
jgi:ATP-dependent exoDNAse (exonuclease V) beta subunit